MIPALTAARAAIAPYALAIKAGLVVLLLIAAAVLWWRVGVWRDGYHEREAAIDAREAAEANLADEIDCLEGTACAERIARLAADGAKAVETARRTAQEAARAEQAARDAEAKAAIDRATRAASEAAVRAQAWRARYEAAKVAKPECKAWSEQPISCPQS